MRIQCQLMRASRTKEPEEQKQLEVTRNIWSQTGERTHKYEAVGTKERQERREQEARNRSVRKSQNEP